MIVSCLNHWKINLTFYVCHLFSNAVIKAEYDKCFVHALAVSDWMSVKSNKKVMIGHK